MIWTLSCDEATVGGHELDSVRVSIVGVALDYTQRDDPTTWPNVLAPDWPANWGIYVIKIYSDDARLAAVLRQAGMPAVVEPHISFEQRSPLPHHDITTADIPDINTCDRVGPAPGLAHSPPDEVRPPESVKTTTVDVPGPHGGFRTAASPLVHHNAVTHCHDQLLWHGPYEDPAKIRLRIPVARDHFCTDPQPACATTEAKPGTEIAAFLGNDIREDPELAFDHEPINEVMLTEE